MMTDGAPAMPGEGARAPERLVSPDGKVHIFDPEREWARCLESVRTLCQPPNGGLSVECWNCHFAKGGRR